MQPGSIVQCRNRAWRLTLDDLSRLRTHFPNPRRAAEHILNSLPIVLDYEEKARGTYRTRDTILALYDEMTRPHRKAGLLTPIEATLTA